MQVTIVAMLLLHGLLFVALYTDTMVLYTNCSNSVPRAVFILCDGIVIIQDSSCWAHLCPSFCTPPSTYVHNKMTKQGSQPGSGQQKIYIWNKRGGGGTETGRSTKKRTAARDLAKQ